MTTKFHVVHPVLHDPKLKAKRIGDTIELEEGQATELLRSGHISRSPLTVEVPAATPQAVHFGESTLSKLTVGELTAYASAHAIALTPGSTKEQILSAIETGGAVAEVKP